MNVAAVADPATGLAVYDPYGTGTGTGWEVFGGRPDRHGHPNGVTAFAD